MSETEKRVLRKNYAFLVKKLDPVGIRSLLHAEGLLTDYELAEIQAQPVTPAANELILSALKRRAPGFMEKFCEILEDEPANKYIVDKLREGIVDQLVGGAGTDHAHSTRPQTSS